MLATTAAHAQNAAPSANTYPSRPVRVIVPFAPGGPADIVARLLTQKLSEHLGRQFYVENMAGADGNLGRGAAARATPDGYTLVLVSSSYMVNPSLYPKVPYDQAKDFLPVTLPAYAPNVLVCESVADFPARRPTPCWACWLRPGRRRRSSIYCIGKSCGAWRCPM
jgi:tripartite-type tricarboxylate transporter receptor subunit TctC